MATLADLERQMKEAEQEFAAFNQELTELQAEYRENRVFCMRQRGSRNPPMSWQPVLLWRPSAGKRHSWRKSATRPHVHWPALRAPTTSCSPISPALL
jgi:hypothetical protein